MAVVDGEIRVRGPQVAVSGADGWLRTGDRGLIDDDGYLFVEGRADDVIIRGGENISPAEVEDALLRHESVMAAVVAGVADEEWGERVGAMVVLLPGAQVTGDELAGFARELLGSLKAPEVVLVRDELPLTPTGKVLRRQVRIELEQS